MHLFPGAENVCRGQWLVQRHAAVRVAENKRLGYLLNSYTTAHVWQA